MLRCPSKRFAFEAARSIQTKKPSSTWGDSSSAKSATPSKGSTILLKPELHHFERAAREVSKHGDNDTLPFDIDVRFCGDEATALATIAHGFYMELRDSKVSKDNSKATKGNLARIPALRIHSERLLAPSGPAGFRVVAKIHPFWNVYLNGLTIAIAEVLEPRRSDFVHSYRFLPDGGDRLFDETKSWRSFKEVTVAQTNVAGVHAFVVQTDISSFYDRVSHHYLENLIDGLGGDAEEVAAQVQALLSKFFAGRSFGLPVGGQGARILSELLLNEVDGALTAKGVQWHRYVDDYVLIAKSAEEAYRVLGILAHALMDYGLSLNKSKTVFLSAKHYRDYVTSQLGEDDDEAAKLRSIDLKFDPYSDNPEEDYESLVETVETLDVRRLLNRELEKSLPDSFLVTQIGRVMRLREPVAALEIAEILLKQKNLNAFRSSFSTIMRGVAALRDDARFSSIHPRLDLLLDAVPEHSVHLLKADTSLLHYLRALRFRSTQRRQLFVRRLFDQSQLDIVRRACIDCWRGWRDTVAFNHLRNNWQQMSPECQRLYWVASLEFGNEGKKVRQQAERALRQSSALGFEGPRVEGLRFASVFMKWAEKTSHAV